MSDTLEIAVLEKPLQAKDLFVQGGIESVCGEIEKKARSVVLDVSTAKGRGEIKSLAYKITRSKTTLDSLGKDLVAEWKKRVKLVDTDRRLMRNRLDALRDEIRQPLTDWEKEQKEQEEAEKLAKEIESAHELALVENEKWNLEQELKQREAEAAMIKAAAEARAKKEKDERERIAREAELAREAEERGRIEAEAKAEAERRSLEAEAIQARAAEIRAKEERAKLESRREQEIAEVKKQAKEQERARQEAIELARKEKERKEKEEADKKAANIAHQRKVNNEIVAAMTSDGLLSVEQAKGVIKNIIIGKYPHISINY